MTLHLNEDNLNDKVNKIESKLIEIVAFEIYNKSELSWEESYNIAEIAVYKIKWFNQQIKEVLLS